MPGGPNMTSFRAVRPNLAWEARSSVPTYASTSTIRPTRRSRSVWDAPGSRWSRPPTTSRAPMRARAASSVGAARVARATVRFASEPDQHGGEGVDHVLRKQEPEPRQHARDDVLAQDLRGQGVVDEAVEPTKRGELSGPRGLSRRRREVRVHDDQDRGQDDQAFEHPE